MKNVVINGVSYTEKDAIAKGLLKKPEKPQKSQKEIIVEQLKLKGIEFDSKMKLQDLKKLLDKEN
jgi:hypothetical protein